MYPAWLHLHTPLLPMPLPHTGVMEPLQPNHDEKNTKHDPCDKEVLECPYTVGGGGVLPLTPPTPPPLTPLPPSSPSNV